MSATVERRGRLSPITRHIIKHNLTGNKYGKYIPRQSLENEIVKFLKNDSENYQIISGLGGMGKSSLIFSVLSKIIDGSIELGKTVDSIIWVTDSYNPGDLDVNKLIDEINSVYGYTNESSQEDTSKIKMNKAKQFLNLNRNTMSILVVDNFETVKDDELRRFIFELPQTCKVILTSKINRDACIRTGVIIMQNAQCINDFPIPSFSESEWFNLFGVICNSVQIINDWANSFANKNTLKRIISVTYEELGGIPFPFERVLTEIAEKQFVDVSKIKRLINSVITEFGVYDRMISYSWDKLERNSRATLLAAALSGYLSTINFELLSLVSGLEASDNDDNIAEIGSPLYVSIGQCLNYKLIEIDKSNGKPTYYLPAIVYRFVINKLMNDSNIKSDFSDVIRNWIDYYKSRTEKIGMCFNNTEIMREFDTVNQKEALEFILDYCYQNSLYHDYVVISNNMRYFFYTRSIWCVGDKCVHIKRAKAANRIGDYLSELEAYVYYINIASKYRQFDKVSDYLCRVREIIEANNVRERNPDAYFRYQHTLGLYYYHGDDYNNALSIWENLLSEPIITDNIHDIDAATRWYTKCLIKQVDSNANMDSDIIGRITNLLTVAKEHNFERAIIDYTLLLVRINAQQNLHEEAKQLLKNNEIIGLIEKTNDSLYKAKYYLWCAYYSSEEEKLNNIETAKALVDSNVLKNILQKDLSILGEAFGGIFE